MGVTDMVAAKILVLWLTQRVTILYGILQSKQKLVLRS